MADIKKELNAIKNAVYGKEVRGSIHDGIKKINDEVEISTDLSESAKHQVENIQQQVNQLVVEGDSSVEAAQARVDADGNTFTTLKERLDTKETQFASQLEQKTDKEQTESFISANMYTTIQNAIDIAIETGKKLLVPGGTYNINEGLVIDGPISFEGSMSNVLFDFSQMTEGAAITIGQDGGVNGLVMSGLQMRGNENITALKLNGTSSISRPVTDSSFSNMRIEGFGIGLAGEYAWCNLFENVRFHNCDKVFELGSQFNNTNFNRVTWSSFNRMSTFTNCEGIHFDSPNIANVEASVAFEVFQSVVTMTNPYIEYLNGSLARVGRASEQIKSSLTLIAPKVTDDSVEIELNSDSSRIRVINPDKEFRIVQVEDRIQGGKSSENIKVDSPNTTLPTYLFNYNGQQEFDFIPAYGGSNTVINKEFHDEGVTLNIVGTGYNGILLSSQLEVGKPYTLLYAIKSVGDVAIKNNGESQTLRQGSDDFKLFAFPFTAKSSIIRIVWDIVNDVTIRRMQLVKGQHFS